MVDRTRPRLAPFSIILTREERRVANGEKLGGYIKRQLFETRSGDHATDMGQPKGGRSKRERNHGREP